MGVMTTKFLGKFGEIVFILRNAFVYRGLRKFLGDCYTLSPLYIIGRPSWRSFFIFSLNELKEWRKLLAIRPSRKAKGVALTLKAAFGRGTFFREQARFFDEQSGKAERCFRNPKTTLPALSGGTNPLPMVADFRV